ncbi:MAG: sugar phosphate isomerase/epimerase family protein [Aureliella sp.]
MDRREFSKAACVAATVAGVHGDAQASNQSEENQGVKPEEFELRYMLASCLFGYQYIREILPAVAATGATAIDIWPKVHGNQREQLDDLGEAKFKEMLETQNVKLGCITQYKLGPFGLSEELRLAERLGCKTIVTGAKGPKGLKGAELKAAVENFAEAMKPHVELAAECGVTIAIENHANSLIESHESMAWLIDSSHENLGIALAPYHLKQDAKSLAELVQRLAPRIAVFYAWQHGKGCMTKLPKKQELLQLPGRGDLDFGPILEALRDTNYSGWTEIFMHPVPRGIPMLETAGLITEEINRSRAYLEGLLTTP